MAADLKDLLRKTLDELTGAEFKRFKYRLRDEGRIAWGTLEKADTDDTVEEMVKVYSMGAGDVMEKVLRTMNHNHLVMDLESELRKLSCWQYSSRQSGEANRNNAGQLQGYIPLPTIQSEHKEKMKGRVENIHQGMERTETQALVKEIFTELYITEGKMEEVNNEHEVWQMEAITRSQITEDSAICYNDLFKPLPGQKKNIKAVLTMGIAGIGKTVLVKKFILDWCEGAASEDVDFMFMLPFREMNLIEGDTTLHELLCIFCPELKQLQDMSVYDGAKMVIIFDGLDESRTELDFKKKIIASATQMSTVDVLVTNIIRGKLLPSARVWVTSRPAAINQIPSACIDRVTEVRGFNDVQKEEYFHRNSEPYANQIVSHIKSSRTLHIMCHIPIFCWILATVLMKMLKENRKEMPKTLTEMYIYFLLIQTKVKNQKYHGGHETNKQILLGCYGGGILKLAKLAFNHLYKSSILFYFKHLEECDIDVREGSVYSGMFTGIFKEDSVFFEEKIYCFVHLSIQEFLAALHVFISYLNKNDEVLGHFLNRKAPVSSKADVPLDEMLKGAVNKALESKNGHLDLFVRFLHGISLESNQRLLLGLLTRIHSSPESVKKTITNLKVMQRPNVSPERYINLSHCLVEMHDSSVHDEIQTFLKADKGSFQKELSPANCSALAYVLMVSDEVLVEFDLKKYNASLEGRRRLVPAVRCCKKALLAGCGLTETSCDTVASALQSVNSPVRDLDLSHNVLRRSGEKLLSGLQSPNCKLEMLRLVGCGLTEESGGILAFALQSVNSHLRELDLSKNTLGDCGGKLCPEALNPHCKLQTLRLSGCKLTEGPCEVIASAVQSWVSLTELDLTDNHMSLSGIHCLNSALGSLKLQILRLVGCGLTEESGGILAFALQSVNSHLRELDLSKNTLGDCGGKLCSAALNPHCKLEKLRLAGCNLPEQQCEVVASAVQYMESLTELDLSGNGMGITGLQLLNAAMSRILTSLAAITETPCEVIASAVQSWVSLTELDLGGNRMGLSGIQILNATLCHLNLQMLRYHHGENGRIKPQLRECACEVTLDPNTANRRLVLSDEDRTASCVTKEQMYPDHPDRFDISTAQVLCREGLSGCCYWEAEWSGGGLNVAVAYKSIQRKGVESFFGETHRSWILKCEGDSYSAWHNKTRKAIPTSYPISTRVGVYLDWPAGTLSFYSVSSDTLTHLHTFHATFTEPLYPGFIVHSQNTSVSLCQMT